MKFYFFTCLLVLTFSSAFSQKTILDSLNNEFYKSNDTKIKINILCEALDKLQNVNKDSSLLLIEKIKKKAIPLSHYRGIGIAHKTQTILLMRDNQFKSALENVAIAIKNLEQTDDYYNLGLAWGYKAYCHDRLGDIEKAFDAYYTAKEISKRAPNKKYLYVIENNLGTLFQKQGKYIEAMTCYKNALLEAGVQKNEANIAACLTNIGNILYFQQKLDMALEYYLKAMKIREKVNDLNGLALSYNNIGSIYLVNLDFSKALFYLEKAKEIHQKFNDKNGVLQTEINICSIYYLQNQAEKAIYCYEGCLRLSEELNSAENKAMIFVNLSTAYRQNNDPKKAIETAKKGLDLAYSIAAKKTIGESLGALALAYEANKDFEKAVHFQKKYKAHEDSLFNLEKTKQTDALLLEQKNIENKFLAHENELKTVSLERMRLSKEAKERELAILKQRAEAQRLLALAQAEKDNRKADSLFNAYQKAELKAENMLMKSQKIEAEDRVKIAMQESEINFQRGINTFATMLVLLLLVFLFLLYRQKQFKQKLNTVLAEKNEEIRIQNQTLEKTNQTKDQLFAIIAHDLRSPIIAFQGISKQIDFFIRKNKPERIHELGLHIDNSAENINNLLTNLLSWALVQKKEIAYEPEYFDLNLMVEELLKTYRPLAISHQIELYFETNQTNMEVFADTNSIATILRNLVSNALKYTPENGKVSLILSYERNCVHILVRDTGMGIAADKLAKIFDLKNKNSIRGLRGEKGVGLGLVLCTEFATLNQATLRVESVEGKGTTFCLSIFDIREKQ